MPTATKRRHKRTRALERAFELSASEVASGRRTLEQHEQFVADVLAGEIELRRRPNPTAWLAGGVTGVCAVAVLVVFGFDEQPAREPRAAAPAERPPRPAPTEAEPASPSPPPPDPRFSAPDKPSPDDYRPECPPRFCPTGSTAFLYVKDWRLSAKASKLVGPRHRRWPRVRVLGGSPVTIRLEALDNGSYTVWVSGVYRGQDRQLHNGRWTMHVGPGNRVDQIRVLAGLATTAQIKGADRPQVEIEGYSITKVGVPRE